MKKSEPPTNLDHEKVPSVDELRQLVIAELEEIGLSIKTEGLKPSRNSKKFTKRLHAPARELLLVSARKWISYAWEKHKSFFARGQDINPQQVSPKLVEVITNDQRELFRLARYTWSLPYTKGYG